MRIFFWVFLFLCALSVFSLAKKFFSKEKAVEDALPPVKNTQPEEKQENSEAITDESVADDSGYFPEKHYDLDACQLDTPSEVALYEWLTKKYGGSKSIRLFKRLYFDNPYVNNSSLHYFNIDVALLSKRGVIVFEVKENKKAYLIIFQRGEYVALYRDKVEKNKVYGYNYSPFLQNHWHLKKLNRLFSEKRLLKIPMTGIVVNFLTGKTEVAIDYEKVPKKNKYFYLFAERKEEKISTEETNFKYLEKNIERFLKRKDLLDDETFNRAEQFLSAHAEADEEIVRHHREEINNLKKSNY